MRFQTIPRSEILLFGIPDFTPIPLPKFASSVECGNSTTGFASPADEHVEANLDLNEFHHIRKHVTFLVRAVGDSMNDAGISENDVLIVDTSMDYRENDVVICCLNGSHKAKTIKREKGKLYLKSRNPLYAPIEIQESDDLRIFGVVKGLSRNFRRD
ncbi:LexA family protein [Spirosoma pulveris]